MDGGTKEKYSYGKHIRQRNALPSYWVTQTQDTHPSNQTHWERIVRENKPKQKFILKDLFQWPCSSFSVDLKHTRRWDLNFIRRCEGVYYKIPMALFFLLDILCFRPFLTRNIFDKYLGCLGPKKLSKIFLENIIWEIWEAS